MLTPGQEILDRIRVYVDDDHADNQGWLSPTAWLRIINAEYITLYKRWVRQSLIAPAYIDVAFTGPSVTIPDEDDEDGVPVFAIVGVVEDTGSGYRPVYPEQSTFGRAPFRYPTDARASSWSATGMDGTITLNLHPEDTTGNYIVRYLPLPTLLADITDSLSYPAGGDERHVLGVAKRAHLKDSATSSLLENLIQQADAELAFDAFGRNSNDSPRVRIVDKRRRVFPLQAAFAQFAPTNYRFV